MIGLHALGSRRTGGLGWVAITLVTIGFGAQWVAGIVASTVTWGDLSACVNPRDCNIYDPAGLFRLASTGIQLGVILSAIGLLLVGVVVRRARVLPQGGALPFILAGVSLAPTLLLIGVLTLLPSTDAAGDIKLEAALSAFGLAATVLWALLGRAILRAPIEASPAIATTAS